MTAEFRNGLEVLRERERKPKLTSGSLELDSLLAGGIELGSFTVIYGEDEPVIDTILYTLICRTLLPVERYGYNGKVVLFTCGDYRSEQALVDLKLASNILRGSGIDPEKGLEEIIVVSTFNADQAEQSVEDILKIIKYNEQLRLIVVRNLAKLFIENAPRDGVELERVQRLQHLIAKLWQACSEREVSLILSCRSKRPNTLRPSPPEGGIFLRHLAQTILCIKRKDRNTLTAHLVKHPHRHSRMVEFEYSQEDFIMGRLTVPFRIELQKEIENLTRSFKEALMDPARRDAFDSLTRAWTGEQGAMSYAKVPSLLEIMLLTAAVDNRRTIEDLQDEVALLHSQLDRTRSELSEMKTKFSTVPGAAE